MAANETFSALSQLAAAFSGGSPDSSSSIGAPPAAWLCLAAADAVLVSRPVPELLQLLGAAVALRVSSSS